MGYAIGIGPKPAGVSVINRYVAAVHRTTLEDAVVGAAFINAMNLMAPPSSLMSPDLMLRVWQANRRLNRRASQNASQPGLGTPQVVSALV